MTTRAQAHHATNLARALAARPGQNAPAMFVNVVTTPRGGSRLAWGWTPLESDQRVVARFACYPVSRDGFAPEVAPRPVPANAPTEPAWPFPVSAHQERPDLLKGGA